MREMKDSGIEWIGEIPTNWKVVPLKYLLSNEIDSLRVGPFGSTLKGTDFTNEGYWVYNQRTVLDCNFDANDTFISEEKYHTMTGFQIRYNDILITTRGTIGKICRIPKKYYKGIIHPCIIKFRINEDKVLYPYLELIFNSSNLFQTQLTYKSNATTIEVIYSGTLKNLLVPIPASLTLQKQISKYLIQRCNKIDSIVNDIQHQIELLQEYKQSVITEAVTKGLDKNVAMKDSGIEWIGEIASNAKIIRLKHFAYMKGRIGWQGLKSTDFIEEGPYCITGTDFINGQVNWDTCYHVSEERYKMDPYIQVKIGDLLITKDGTIGKMAIISDLPYKACLNSHLLIVRPLNNKFTNKYLYYVMLSDIFSHYYSLVSNGTTMDSLSQEKMGNFSFPIYDTNIQHTITNYLDKKCAEIDAVLADKQKQLDTLTEYKKSLIYEYVTGKKEVPADA